MINRIFFHPDFRRYVLFTADALNHMYAHVQRKWWQKEAGGEIYTADPDSHGFIITAATGPNPRDSRGRHSFNPDTVTATHDRERQFAQGRHAIGLWHTHPETWPSPSEKDRQTTDDYLKAFQNQRDRYLTVILGNQGDTPNMTVWSSGLNEWCRWVEAKKLDQIEKFAVPAHEFSQQAADRVR